MQTELGVHVQTRDGKDVGKIDRLILDPDSGDVKAVVLRKGFLLPRDVEVPLESLQEGTDGTLRLTYSADQVSALPEFFESSYTTTPPAGYNPRSDMPAAGLYWPAPMSGMAIGLPSVSEPVVEGSSAVRDEVEEALRKQDLESAVISEGSAVQSEDGQTVGHLHQLIFDSNSGQLTGFIVRKGIVAPEDQELSAETVARVDDGIIYLKIPAKDLRARRAG